jgi:hypothetical protein
MQPFTLENCNNLTNLTYYGMHMYVCTMEMVKHSQGLFQESTLFSVFEIHHNQIKKANIIAKN